MNIRNSQWVNVINSPDVFQEIMNEFFNGLDYVRTYIDDLLIISNTSLEDHIEKLDKVLSKLKSAGFKINVGKSCFTRNKLDYLGFKILGKA